jgi:hypothetical protein
MYEYIDPQASSMTEATYTHQERSADSPKGDANQAREETARTSLRYVFSSRPLTILAALSLEELVSSAVIMGVEMSLAALMISLIRGTPSVMDMAATPAKWKLPSSTIGRRAECGNVSTLVHMRDDTKW